MFTFIMLNPNGIRPNHTDALSYQNSIFNASIKLEALRGDWDLVEQQLSANGIAIPKYDPEGLLFSIDAKAQCITEKLLLDSPQELQKAITRLSSPVAAA
jgi:hypothetical protein